MKNRLLVFFILLTLAINAGSFIFIQQAYLVGSVYAKDGVSVSSIPRATHSITEEQIGSSKAFAVHITNIEDFPDYRYQFLEQGLRIYIDRKDGFGWVPVVSQVIAIPEYKKQQGDKGKFVWEKYHLALNKNDFQGFQMKEKPDGSVELVRTFSTSEESVGEVFTESWTIPNSTEKLIAEGPKAEYRMTKNRGIVEKNDVNEGSWRMNWEIKGIKDIDESEPLIEDERGLPVRSKEYLDGQIEVDISDFDNLYDEPMHTFSEDAEGKKVSVIFFDKGTEGERLVDPSVVTSNITVAWEHNSQRNIFYNGTNFCVFYDKGSTSLFARCDSSISGLSSASEQTVVSGQIRPGLKWDIYMVNDATFDVGYISNTDNQNIIARTCTLSGTTISCASDSVAFDSGTTQVYVTIVRTPSADRIWLVGDRFFVSADQTGASSNISTWTDEVGPLSANHKMNAAVPYGSSDKVLEVMVTDGAGTGNDGFSYMICTRGSACSSEIVWLSFATPPVSFGGNVIRISDTDFRYVYSDANNDIIEAKFDGSSTWTATHATVHTGTDDEPAIFYDRISNVGYAVYADSSDDIWYHVKTCMSNSGCSEGSWGVQTNADNDETDANSLPVVQMVDPPEGSSRTGSVELAWCYRNENSTNFDVVCSQLSLVTPTPAPSNTPTPVPGGGVQIRGGTTIRGGSQINP